MRKKHLVKKKVLDNFLAVFKGWAVSFLLLIFACALSALSIALSTVQAGAEPEGKGLRQDIVFLLDTSSSMRNMFEDVRQAILDYARQAQVGDTIILITFGEKTYLSFRQKITSPEDVRLIERELAKVSPNQYYTYITAALDKGIRELELLDKREGEHISTLVLLSDGKNNPPPSVETPVTFGDLLKNYPTLLQNPRSAFFYLSLGDKPDPDVVEWMETAKGRSIDLGEELADSSSESRQFVFAQILVEPISLDLGTISGPKATIPVSLAFFPARGDASGQEIQLGFKAIYQENPSWKTLLEAKPSGITCSKKPWTTSLSIQVDSLQEGTIVGTLELKPLPGHVLFIDPPEIPVTVTMRQPEIKVEKRERLKFGPIFPGAGHSEKKTITLTSNTEIEPDDIRVTPSIALPDEMSLDAKVQKLDSTLVLQIDVATREEIKTDHSLRFEGTVTLSGARYPINFSDDEIEVTIEVAPPPAQSGLIENIFSRMNARVIGVILGIPLAIAVGFLVFRYIRSRPASALEGKLLLINLNGQSRTTTKVTAVSLNSLGKSLRRDSVTIGSAKDAGFTLPHKSVDPYHCEIYVKMDKGTKRIFIGPAGKSKLIVNLQQVDGPVPLSDRDLLEIGAYTFRFENPHPFKQLVVKYLDGRILKGTPASWDIDSDGFNILPRDALPGSNEEIYISFADLKAVYFVRDFDGQIGRKLVSPATQIHGLHMLITFHDNEKIEGYTSESYSPESPRFYFFPADQSGNTISLLVEREHLKDIQVLDSGKQTGKVQTPVAAQESARRST
jgi:hypothetical protein